MGVKHLVDDIKRAMPGLAKRARTRGGAIHLFCLECMGADPGFPGAMHAAKQAVKLCTASKCPLHPFRPYQKASLRVPSDILSAENRSCDELSAGGIPG